jgi:aminomethyltransferase
MSGTTASASLSRTPLYDLHVSLGAKMVPFAGFEMPVQYPLGVLKEHLWTREKAGLFDVSHMGQAYLVADDGKHETVARALEALIPADVLNLAPGQQRYSQLLADDGGILDDLMFARSANATGAGVINLVVNAGCKTSDYAHISSRITAGVRLDTMSGAGLLALQGPMAAHVFCAFVPAAATMPFMAIGKASIEGIDIQFSRSGYTGEDGFEISVKSESAASLWQLLLKDPRVQPIGLGARDSLRLEAGLCLYGHDIDTTTSPIEAGLAWSIQKRRRAEGGFPGAARIQAELANGPARKRVGIRPEGRAPAREGTEILSAAGEKIGVVTSGGFGPTLNAPIAMGYVAATHSAPGTPLQLMVRGKPLAASVVAMPFVPNRFFRKS